MNSQIVELKVSADLIQARLSARELALRAQLGVMDQTRFATAVSELGRNALVYAGGGRCELRDMSDSAFVRLQATVSDAGPGIADVAQAMTDGYSTSGSLGAGLPGARRLVDQFSIQSDASGTVVNVQIVRRKRGV